MKNIFRLVVFLMAALMHSQEFNYDKSLRVLKTYSYGFKETQVSMVEARNKILNKYEYRFYLKNQDSIMYSGNYLSKYPMTVEFHYRFDDKIFFVLSDKHHRSSVLECKLLSFDVGGNKGIAVNDLSSLNIKKPTVKFSFKDYSCFVYKEKEEIKLITFTDKVVEKTIRIPDDLLEKYSSLKSRKIQVVNTLEYSEDIGAPLTNLFFDDNNIYVVYMLPKLRKNIICEFSKKGSDFEWSGYKELDFTFSEKIKKYNSYLLNDIFYFVEKNKKQVYLSVLNLENDESKVYDLSKLAEDEVINKYQLDRITNSYSSQIPSIVVYNQKDSGDKIIKIASIHKNRTYYDPFFFQDQFRMQQQINMQNSINNLSIPGRFNMMSFPSLDFWDKKTKELKFVITSKGVVRDYKDEKLELLKEDSIKDKELMMSYFKNRLDGFRLKYLSFDSLKSRDLYYTYYDSKRKKLLIGVKRKQ